MKIKDTPEQLENIQLYMNNARLKAAGVKLPLTKEQYIEMTRIVRDPIYFIETYCQIVSIDHGYVPFKMYEYQKRLVKSIHENRKTIALFPRQSGKCVSAHSLIKIKHRLSGKNVEVAIGDFYTWLAVSEEFKNVLARQSGKDIE